LSTLAPHYLDPVSSKTITQLLSECSDTSWVKPLGNEVMAT
jgi:hypothetical protein